VFSSVVDFVPVAIETSGVRYRPWNWSPEIGRRLASAYELCSMTFLCQCILVAVKHRNAYCILGTLQSTKGLSLIDTCLVILSLIITLLLLIMIIIIIVTVKITVII